MSELKTKFSKAIKNATADEFFTWKNPQKRVQRGKGASGFSRGEELPLCNCNTYPQKTVVETVLIGIGKG